MIDNLNIGDFVSHKAIPKTVGILIQKEDVGTLFSNHIWHVWWLQHPDIEEFGQFAYVGDKWIKQFKPWPGFYKSS